MLSKIIRTSALCLILAIVSAPNYSFAIISILKDSEYRSVFDNIRKFDRNGQKIPPGSKCEGLLHEAEKRLGRPLTAREIDANLDVILKATGESLNPAPTPGAIPSPPRHFCFVGTMKVATPKGERSIGELKVGDEVISIDLETKTPVVNRIYAIADYPNRTYGRLQDLERPIDVTERHPFFTQAPGSAPRFAPIEEISAQDSLFSVDLKPNASNVLTPVPRGCYLPQEGTASVFDLQLEGEPRNFIVEGILVHNVKVKI